MRSHEKTPANLVALSKISLVIDSTKAGIPYETTWEKIQSYNNEADARGDLSVENVARAISTLPFINTILETKQKSHEDVRELRDLIVLLDNRSVKGVGVQVKSRAQAVIDFYKRFNPDQEKAKQVLIKRKLILLNGQLPDDIIKKFFLDRLSEIDQFFKNQPEDKKNFSYLERCIKRKIK
jgi:hypothetical protein